MYLSTDIDIILTFPEFYPEIDRSIENVLFRLRYLLRKGFSNLTQDELDEIEFLNSWIIEDEETLYFE